MLPMAPSVATTWKPTGSVVCDLAVSRQLQRSVIAYLSGGSIALTSNVFLPRAPRFQTALIYLVRAGTGGETAGQGGAIYRQEFPRPMGLAGQAQHSDITENCWYECWEGSSRRACSPTRAARRGSTSLSIGWTFTYRSDSREMANADMFH